VNRTQQKDAPVTADGVNTDRPTVLGVYRMKDLQFAGDPIMCADKTFSEASCASSQPVL
jgi:hypothetical protein